MNETPDIKVAQYVQISNGCAPGGRQRPRGWPRSDRRMVHHKRQRHLDQRHPRLLGQPGQSVGDVELALVLRQRHVVASRDPLSAVRVGHLDLTDDPAAGIAELVRVVADRPVDLGGEDHVVALAAGKRLADDLLGLTSAENVGGVDEVDPGVERAMDDPDAPVVVGVAPGAEHHRAEAQRADLDSRTAERTQVHLWPRA